MKFHTYKWNQRDREYTMIILNEEMIENESDSIHGAGFEILVLPLKYKEIHTKYLDIARLMVETRCGEIIYI